MSLTPLVILHGLFGSSRNWQTISKRLTFELSGKMIYPIDLRNHNCVNNPEAPIGNMNSWDILQKDLESFWIEKLNQTSFDLLGHSFGGQIAMSSVLKESKLRNAVKKLIVVDVSLRHPSSDQPNDKHFSLMKKMMEINKMGLTNRSKVIEELKTIEPNDHVINFLLLNLVKTSDRYTFDNLGLKYIQDSWPLLKSQWKKLEYVPWEGETLFLKGEHSDYISKADESDLRKYFPNSKIETISKSGHWPHFDNQTEFINKLSAFL